MRRMLLCWLLIGLAWLAVSPASAATYSFRTDSFAWETASTALSWDRRCTSYPSDDDQATISFSGGFQFRFGGTAYSSVRVLANGALQFGADTGFMRTYVNTALPAGTPRGSSSGCARAATARTMMAYWTDLNPSASGSGGVTWQQKGTAPNRYVVVSWNNVYQYGTATPYTFQIILFENGEFKYQYGNANASGSNATIGVQLSNSDYTLYSYNSGYNANGAAIRWFVGSDSPTRVAAYRFDEYSWTGTLGEVADSSGNGRNGVRVGNAATVAGGVICRALDIPADTTTTASAVDTLVSPATLGNSGGFTLWVRSDVTWSSSTAAMLVDGSSNASDSFFLMRDAGGALRFVLSDSGSTTLTATTTANGTAAGTWVHVGVAWRLANGNNQSSLRIYVNGVLRATTLGTTSGAIDAALRSLFVGDNRGSSTANGITRHSAHGSIDELRLYNYEIGLAEIAADRSSSHDCLPPVDHYEVSLPSSTLACVGSTIRVTACADGSSPCTNPSTAVTARTAGLSVSGTAALGSPLLIFDANGQASTTLSFPLATDGTVVEVGLLNEQVPGQRPRQCCPDGVACAEADRCATTFATAGFVLAAAPDGPETTIATQTAGTTSATHYLRAVKSGTDTAACEAALTGLQTVDWAYRCRDPATCDGDRRMTIVAAGTSTVPGRSDAATLGYAGVSMTFDAAGNAPVRFNYGDVGRVSLHVRKASAGFQTSDLTGQTTAHVIRPAGFVLGSVRQTAAPGTVNPGATDASGGRFIAAGQTFSATVTAVGSTGLAVPSFGRESSPEGVRLSATLLQPAGGDTGVLSGGQVLGGQFAAGVATAGDLRYGEVGSMTLQAVLADGNYLGSGSVPASPGVAVGRFVPARFALATTSVTHRAGLACAAAPAFTYLGENFRLNLSLTAQNTDGATTRNYTGAFAKLDAASAAAWNIAGVDGTTMFSPASGRLALGSASGSWAGGVASNVALTVQATRAAAPDGPFNAAFGIAPVDADGVALGSYDLDADPAVAGNDRTAVGPVALRFGRLRLLNAIGAADRPLALPVRAEHWAGSAFELNTLDSCSSVPATAVSFGNLRRTLTAADTAVVGSGANLVAGRASLVLAAPGGGRRGTVDVALSLGGTAADASCLQPWSPGSDAATTGAPLAYLRGAWCGTAFDKDPAARASFGLPRGADSWLYRQENP